MRNYFTEIYKNSIMSNNNWNSRIFRLPLSFWRSCDIAYRISSAESIPDHSGGALFIYAHAKRRSRKIEEREKEEV